MAWSSSSSGTDTIFGSITAAKESASVSLSGYTAAEVVSAWRGLWLDGGQFRVARANVASEVEACVAVSVSSAGIGVVVQAKVSGEVSDAVWGWVPGKTVWLSDTGTLSQTPGTHLKMLGTAVSPTRVVLVCGSGFALKE